MNFPGETVTVRTYEEAGRDAYGAPVKEAKETPVANVLVAPGATDDLGEDRPEGADIKYTLCFPKTYLDNLEGAEINVRGEWYDVHGAPGYFDKTFCPTDWNRIVYVEAVHG